jgi:hypothetical protein
MKDCKNCQNLENGSVIRLDNRGRCVDCEYQVAPMNYKPPKDRLLETVKSHIENISKSCPYKDNEPKKIYRKGFEDCRLQVILKIDLILKHYK